MLSFVHVHTRGGGSEDKHSVSASGFRSVLLAIQPLCYSFRPLTESRVKLHNEAALSVWPLCLWTLVTPPHLERIQKKERCASVFFIFCSLLILFDSCEICKGERTHSNIRGTHCIHFCKMRFYTLSPSYRFDSLSVTNPTHHNWLSTTKTALPSNPTNATDWARVSGLIEAAQGYFRHDAEEKVLCMTSVHLRCFFTDMLTVLAGDKRLRSWPMTMSVPFHPLSF